MTHRSIEDLLMLVTEAAREIAGAHQATTSLAPGDTWTKAVHTVSLSDKYAEWRTYAQPPDGSGIYRLVPALNRPMRMTQAELERHPAWRGFGVAAGRHPPMRGWLAAPLQAPDGRGIGVIQLTDKYAGDFTADDEGRLVALARVASVALDELRQAARARRRLSASARRRGRRGETGRAPRSRSRSP